VYGFECRETWAESWTESWLRTSCTAQVINYYMGMLQERELRNNPGARSLFDAAKKNPFALRACELPSEKRGVHPLLQPNAPPVKP
jgi:hypothetical protein